jgi:hypothetical protein
MDVRTAYETWLHDFAADHDTWRLKAIAGNDAEIEDRFYTELSFGRPACAASWAPAPTA